MDKKQKIFMKRKYEELGGNWDDVKSIINKCPLLIEAVREVERDKFKHWIDHLNFSKGMTKKGDQILNYFRNQLNSEKADD
jgi:hypothetical protein